MCHFGTGGSFRITPLYGLPRWKSQIFTFDVMTANVHHMVRIGTHRSLLDRSPFNSRRYFVDFEYRTIMNFEMMGLEIPN